MAVSGVAAPHSWTTNGLVGIAMSEDTAGLAHGTHRTLGAVDATFASSKAADAYSSVHTLLPIFKPRALRSAHHRLEFAGLEFRTRLSSTHAPASSQLLRSLWG